MEIGARERVRARRGPPSTPRRPTRSRGPTPWSRSWGASRWWSRRGRPCPRGSRRRASRCGTCSRRPASTPGDEALPDAGGAARGEPVGARVPAVEVADHRDVVGVGGPHGEGRPGRAVQRGEVAAELAVEVVVAALVEEVQVVVGDGLGVDGTAPRRLPSGRRRSAAVRPTRPWPRAASSRRRQPRGPRACASAWAAAPVTASQRTCRRVGGNAGAQHGEYGSDRPRRFWRPIPRGSRCVPSLPLLDSPSPDCSCPARRHRRRPERALPARAGGRHALRAQPAGPARLLRPPRHPRRRPQPRARTLAVVPVPQRHLALPLRGGPRARGRSASGGTTPTSRAGTASPCPATGRRWASASPSTPTSRTSTRRTRPSSRTTTTRWAPIAAASPCPTPGAAAASSCTSGASSRRASCG